MNPLRVLFLADTHLGYDLPLKPRIERRRRGIDFFKNYELALNPAFDKKVDMVIHGGDMFYRSRIPELLISMAFEPLIKIASMGIPVIIVPGNHERSFIQQSILELHEKIFIFNTLKSFYFQIKNMKVQITGFPCVRKNIRSDFPQILKNINYKYQKAEHIHLFCMHQAIEGAQVGVQNYTFRSNHDTICAKDIPSSYSAILSGHIHRAQILTHGLDNNLLNSKVYYAGSIERTSFAERNEPKGYYLLSIKPTNSGGEVVRHKFVELPTRPMITCEINASKNSKNEIISKLLRLSKQWDKDSIIRINLISNIPFNGNLPTIQEIRQVLPNSMNISYPVDS